MTMQRKKVASKHPHNTSHKHEDKGVIEGVKEGTQKAFEATKEGVGNAVEGVKKAFD